MSSVIKAYNNVSKVWLKKYSDVPLKERSKDHIENRFNCKWKNPKAIHLMYKYTTVYGDPVGVKDKSNMQKGKIHWNDIIPMVFMKMIEWGAIKKEDVPKSMRWETLELRSGGSMHYKPAFHEDTLFMTKRMFIRKQFMPTVSRLSGSVYQYKAGEKFTASCDFYGASVASAFVTELYINGIIGSERAIELYDVFIKKVAGEKEKTITNETNTEELRKIALSSEKVDTDLMELVVFGAHTFVATYVKSNSQPSTFIEAKLENLKIKPKEKKTTNIWEKN